MDEDRQSSNTNSIKIFVSALEPSANIHLKALALALDEMASKTYTNLEVVGIFDKKAFDKCKHIVATPQYDISKLSVMGFIDVFKKIFFYKKLNKYMCDIALGCEKILLMDSSSFHIPLAQNIKSRHADSKIIYYILPQVWAWKSYRSKKIERVCDILCAVLPFESSFYKRASIEGRVVYVGNPLLDELPLEQECVRKNIVFMPGSRRSEIKHIFKDFVRVAKCLDKLDCKKMEGRKILILPKHFEDLSREELLEIYGQGLDNFMLSFDAHTELIKAKFAFICSGTATLEATLLRTPFVLCYKMRKIEFLVARLFVRLNVIGLANILFQALCGYRAGRGKLLLHEELIEDECSVSNLLRAYRDFDYRDFESKSKLLLDYLAHGSSQNVAKILFDN